MNSQKFLLIVLLALFMSACSNLSRKPSSVYFTPPEESFPSNGVSSKTARVEFPDGSLSVLKLNSPAIANDVKEWDGDQIYIDFRVSAESEKRVKSFAEYIDDELNEQINEAINSLKPFLKINLLSNYRCSSFIRNSKREIEGDCVDRVRFWIPRGKTTKTTLLFNNQLIAGSLIGKYSIDDMKEEIKETTGFDEKVKVVEKFIANNTQRVIITLADVIDIAKKCTFNEIKIFTKFGGRIFRESPESQNVVLKVGFKEFNQFEHQLALIGAVKKSYSYSEKFLSVNDVIQLLDRVAFKSDKMQFLNVIKDRIIDVQNINLIKQKFVFDSEKEEVDRIFDR